VSSLALDTWSADAARLGVHRSLDPPGALPHIARVLDAASPGNEHEAELEVQTLAVDATSFGEIRRRSAGDPERMAQTIRAIVAERGKLQNPWTGSGGVLLGRVTSVGRRRVAGDLAAGDTVVPLASLIAIPLTLQAVGPVDPASPHVPVSGRAIVTGSMLCARVPPDLPQAVALTALDVYPAASHVRELAEPGAHVLVLGAGHAGLLAVAAARRTLGSDGSVTAVDVSAEALERAREVDPALRTLRADVTDPLSVARGLEAEDVPRADLTLLCTSVEGAEGTALVATRSRGTVVFFSTATRFAAAALGADAIGSQARLLIPCGLTDDRGEYAFSLLRACAPLRRAFGGGR
jgi:L-erythro-3,5-diaminohexanoate dehydrogenase